MDNEEIFNEKGFFINVTKLGVQTAFSYVKCWLGDKLTKEK